MKQCSFKPVSVKSKILIQSVFYKPYIFQLPKYTYGNIMAIVYTSILSSLLLAGLAFRYLGVNHHKKDVRIFSWLIYLAAIFELLFMGFSKTGHTTAALVPIYTFLEVIVTMWLLYTFCTPRNGNIKKLIVISLAAYIFAAVLSLLTDYENSWFLASSQTVPVAAILISVSAVFTYFNTVHLSDFDRYKNYRNWIYIGLLSYHLLGGFLVFSFGQFFGVEHLRKIYMIQLAATIGHNILYAIAIFSIKKGDENKQDNKNWLSEVV